MVEEPSLAFLDTETSGLDPQFARVTELAVERFSPWPEMKSLGRIEFKVKLSEKDFKNASVRALEINGYDHEDPERFAHDDNRPWEAVKEALKFAVIAGQNVPFDTSFVEMELRFRGLLEPRSSVPWQRRLVDVQSYCHILASEYCVTEDGVFSWGLTQTYAALGGPPLPSHRAGGDIDKAIFIYRLARRRFAAGREFIAKMSSEQGVV